LMMSQKWKPDSVTTPLMSTLATATPDVTSRWQDRIGIVASIGCAVHCAAMPFVISSLPALGLTFLAEEAFHRWMAWICFGIAIAAFFPGFRIHGRVLPAVIAATGLMLLFGAAFGLTGDCCAVCDADGATTSNQVACADACCEHRADDQTTVPSEPSYSSVDQTSLPSLDTVGPWVTPIGGILLVSAHLLNRRYGCFCARCDSPAGPV
jgi:hypothetical protein